MPRVPLFLFLFLTVTFAALAAFKGKVVGITDGDTIRVLQEGKEVKIRLNGIDAPEVGQGFSEVAKSFVSDVSFGQEVTVHSTGTDKYGRTLGEIILPDGRNLNQELVRLGYAWHYKHYSSDTILARLEVEARSLKLGLWSEKAPTAPWDWRRGHTQPVANVPESERGPPSQPTVSAPVKTNVEAASTQTLTLFKTKTGSKYHRSGCRYLKSRIPTTLEDAESQGLAPCGVCHPPTSPHLAHTPAQSASFESPSPSSAPSYGGRCMATTKKGTQCKRSARSGGYCWQHGG